MSTLGPAHLFLKCAANALHSVTETGKKTSKDVDAMFKKAIDALSAYEKKYYSGTCMMAERDESSLTTLERLEEIICV